MLDLVSVLFGALFTVLVSMSMGRLLLGSLRLRFLTDNRDCVTTIPESAASMGYATEVRREQGCFLIEVFSA